jgi:hypothetical protein
MEMGARTIHFHAVDTWTVDVEWIASLVQMYSTEANGKRTCHGCDRQATSLIKCAKCSLFWYCNGVRKTQFTHSILSEANTMTKMPARKEVGLRKTTKRIASFFAIVI